MRRAPYTRQGGHRAGLSLLPSRTRIRPTAVGDGEQLSRLRLIDAARERDIRVPTIWPSSPSTTSRCPVHPFSPVRRSRPKRWVVPRSKR